MAKMMTLDDRYVLARMYGQGARVEDIAAHLRFSLSTIHRELKRGQNGKLDKNQRLAYDPVRAQRDVQSAIRRRGQRHKS